MKDLVLKIVRAFVALLHADADNQTQIATLKGQLADALAQVKAGSFSDSETSEITAAANMVAAADAPTATDVTATAAVAPAPNQSATTLPATVSAAAPADVAAAAATPPETTPTPAPTPPAPSGPSQVSPAGTP